jgi:hypothetical protein
MWRAAGAHQVPQLIVIAPLAYRLRQGSKLLYRKPAFLLCTEENLDPQVVIETYVGRRDIEVNFREEKTLLGVGQAQVRDPGSVEYAPVLSVAAYALLLLNPPSLSPRRSATPMPEGEKAKVQARADRPGPFFCIGHALLRRAVKTNARRTVRRMIFS